MNELIKIQEHKGKQAVSAKELYGFLDVNTRFNDWIARMLDYGFEEDKDFCSILSKSTGGRPSIDYALTLDCAKEIAMIQRTPQGKQAREYFIVCEKKLKEKTKPLNTLDMLELGIKQLREQEQRVTAIENEVLELKAVTQTRPDYFTVVGYATSNKIKVGLQMAAKLGGKASRLCKKYGYPTEEVPDPRFGKVKMYPKSILEQVFADPI
jgi:anti-repressor protein